MKFTGNQYKAINTFDKNLTVSAGAGSGKTTVLVNKYLKLIANKTARLDEILAITFTNKAAQDMRKKVRKYVNEHANSAKPQSKLYWSNIKNHFDSANITTIHSFGLKVLQSHPLECNMHPESKLLDEIQALLLLQDVVSSELTSKANYGPKVKKLIVDLGSSTAVVDALIKVYLKARSLGGEPAQIASLAQQYEEEAREQLIETKQRLIDSLALLKDQALASASKSGFVRRWKQAQISYYQQAISSAKTLNAYELITTIKDIRVKCSRPTKELADLTRAISYKSQSSGYLYKFENLLAFLDALPTWETVNGLITNIHSRYSNLKKAIRALDYSDLEWGLLYLLRDNVEVRKKYQARFKYVMVDEFQDTSPLQQQLVQYLAPYEQNKLFIVGDTRQSIYRFRAAEVEGFINMNHQIIEHAGEKIHLKDNFRSHPVLIDFFNQFFSEVFSNTPIIYEEVIAGRGSQDTFPRVELCIPEEELARNCKAKKRREVEAKIIANKIIDTINDCKIGFGDIAILFRALTDIKIYERQLQQQKIPYTVVGSRGFFDKQEIIDLVNLLTYFTHSQNKIALCGLLRSPLIGLSDEALFHLENQQKLIRLQHCGLLSEKDELLWKKAIADIQEWHSLLLIKPVSFVLQRVVDDTNLNAVLLGSPGYGRQAVANVQKLLNTVIRLEKEGINGRVDILRYISALKDSDAQYGEAVINSESGDAVQIMTVHQAKGLEFDTVIVAQCERAVLYPNTEILQYTKDFGLIVRCRGWHDKPQKNTYYLKMSESEKIKELQESHRLLYVAATRAEERLIFTASPDKWPSKVNESWLSSLTNFLDLSAWPQQDILTNNIARVYIKKEIVEKVCNKNNAIKPVREYRSGIALIGDLPREIKTKPTVSVSALIDYSTCPLLFYYKNIQKLPQIQDLFEAGDSIDQATLGDLLHQVCEKANSRADLNYYWHITLSNSNLAKTVLEKYKARGQKLLNRYAESRLIAEVEQAIQIESEVPFMFKYRGFILSGVIDKIIFKGNNIKIIDYKSGLISDTAIEKYRLQIALYALAVYKQYRLYPNSLTVFFMDSGKEYDYINELSCVEECYNVTDKIIKRLSEDLNNNKYPKREITCRRCIYKLLCKNSN